jgi:NADH-quinone oxidoreductase subunit J
VGSAARSPDYSGNRPAAVVVALGTAATLVTVLVAGFRAAYVDLGKEPTGGSAHSLGSSIFRQWVLPFEVLSVLLLAALVGAIVLSRGNIGRLDPPAEPEQDQYGRR